MKFEVTVIRRKTSLRSIQIKRKEKEDKTMNDNGANDVENRFRRKKQRNDNVINFQRTFLH